MHVLSVGIFNETGIIERARDSGGNGNFYILGFIEYMQRLIVYQLDIESLTVRHHSAVARLAHIAVDRHVGTADRFGTGIKNIRRRRVRAVNRVFYFFGHKNRKFFHLFGIAVPYFFKGRTEIFDIYVGFEIAYYRILNTLYVVCYPTESFVFFVDNAESVINRICGCICQILPLRPLLGSVFHIIHTLCQTQIFGFYQVARIFAVVAGITVDDIRTAARGIFYGAVKPARRYLATGTVGIYGFLVWNG